MNIPDENLTKIAGVPTKRTAVPGMAYFAGTGPAGKTCNSCTFIRPSDGRSGKRCRKYDEFTKGHRGTKSVTITGHEEACKYYEAQQPA